ncbi:Ulp1 peptidase [Sarracenia purpurea var. burkii]
MESACKRFEAFEFKEENDFSELVSAKLASKFKNPSSIDKYNFIEQVAQGTNFQSKEVDILPCVDIDAIDDDRNCDNALPFIPLGAEGEDLATKQMCGMGDVFLYNSIGHEHHPQFIPDKLRPGSFSTLLERSASSNPAGNSQLRCAPQESTSSDESVDVIPDVDESLSESSPSNSSDSLGDDGPLYGLGPLSDYCLGGLEMGNRNEAVVCPDYIRYRGGYYTESVLIFSSSCIELKGSTAFGNEGTFQWGIDDIVDIESQWSERLQLAMVKLHFIPKDAMQAEGGQGTPDVEELLFAVVELNWYKKQEEIMSLDVRYKARWNVVFDSDIGGDGEALCGQNSVCVPKERYFPNFDESFEEVVYPKGDPDAVTICKRDVDLLQPDTFVNDTIIDFYIKYLKNEMQPEERHRFHFFNSFFFRKLIDLDKDPSSAFEGRAAFQRVRKWTRKVNLFEKDFVFIPVNFNYHWSLIVICHPGEVAKFQDEDMEKSLKVPCILHMDSIKGTHTGLKDLVQSYLWEEWRERQEASEDMSSKFLNLRFVSLELPQQQNSFDCGLFLLHYVECFLEDAPVNFSPFKITKFSNFLNVDWFPAAEPSLKRVRLQSLICKILERENSPAACTVNPCTSIPNYPTNNNEIETVVELISERCSPSKSCHGNLSSSPADQGIEITLLPTTSQCAADSGLVLREFFEGGATAGSFLGGEFKTFDQATSREFKGAMEEDVEAGGQFSYSQSNITGFQQRIEITPPACVFPYSSGDFESETPWNPGIQQAELQDIDASPEASLRASDDSSEAEENNTVREDLGTEEKIDQPGSELNGERVLEKIDQLGSELNGRRVLEGTDNDLVLESNGLGARKRIEDDDLLAESDELQLGKRRRLSLPSEEKRSLSKDLQL